MSLKDKTILLGVSGSIAAYKAADLCSRLSKEGAQVHVVLTAHAAQFVGVPTFRALTRNPVITDLFDEPETGRIAHIELAQSASLVLVAPATANVIAKLAVGLADDMLSTCLLATPSTTPLLLAPAMNTVMWDHPATRTNIESLRRRGARIIEPGYGLLACQDVGDGKLAAVDDIVHAARASVSNSRSLEGVRFLITAGATREPLDPVRFLTNRSSGRMGFAIAEEAARRGAVVTVVAGSTSVPAPQGVAIIRVETAAEMLSACMARSNGFDVFIAAAAVADFTPEAIAPTKLKKPTGGGGTLTLRLRQTADVLAAVAAARQPGQLIVGFAAETEDLVPSARRKLVAKGADLIVANDVTQSGAGFDIDTNIVTLVTEGSEQVLPLLPKSEVAARLLDAVQQLREPLRQGAPSDAVR